MKVVLFFTCLTVAASFEHHDHAQHRRALVNRKGPFGNLKGRVSASPSSKQCSADSTSPVLLPTKSGQACPMQCPFTQVLPGDPCTKVCVAWGNCGEFHPAKTFADPRTKRCSPTCGHRPEERIPGCVKCAGVGVCAECASGFGMGIMYKLDTKTGRCVNTAGKLWLVIYCVIGALGMLLVAYLLALWCRPVTNRDVMKKALVHREMCKPRRRTADNPQGEPYPLLTNVHKEEITGQGVFLYFDTLLCLMAFVTVVGVAAYATHEYSSYAFKANSSVEALRCYMGQDAASRIGSLVGDYQDYNKRMFVAVGLIYVFVVILSWAFAAVTLRRSANWDATNSTHSDYALMVSNLPADVTAEQVAEHLRASAGRDLRIVGVSLAYDYREIQDDVDVAINAWLSRLNGGGADDALPPPQRSERSCCSCRGPTCFCVDDVLLKLVGGNEESLSDERLRELITDLKCSGHAVVVFESEDEVATVLDCCKRGQMQPLGTARLQPKIKSLTDEPPDVCWWNFTQGSFLPKLILGFFVVLGTIALWAMTYLPYAMEYISYSRIPGEKPSTFSDLLLGLLIAVGNALVGNVTDMVNDWAGWRLKAKRDCAVLVLAFFMTLLNTVCDLWMVVEVAKGIEMDESFEGESTAYDRVLARELFVLIVPGYLLLPCVLQPIFERTVPFWLTKWVVRSRPVSQRQADKMAEPLIFDAVWRYSDILNNVTICLLLLLFVTPNAWKIMAYLLGFLIMVYLVDRYTLLRWSSETFYTTNRLQSTFFVLWIVPTGVLAGITAWWGLRANILPSGWMCLCVLVVHIMLYLGGLAIVFKLCVNHKSCDVGYTDAVQKLCDSGKTYTYFNTNPILCLRQRLLDDATLASVEKPSGGPLVPHGVGRSHLQMKRDVA